MSLISSNNYEGKATPIDINKYFEVLGNFINRQILGKTNLDPLYFIKREYTPDGQSEKITIEYDKELFFIGTEPYYGSDNEKRYYVYNAEGEIIGSTNGLDGQRVITLNVDTGEPCIVIPLQTIYRVVENDKTLKFNGKNYAISNEGSYKNLIEEVIIHNKLLQDIISYIDKNPDTAESTKPTTESLI